LAGEILRAKGSGAKVDAEAGAPDADRLVLVQVGLCGHLVVLIAFVALQRAEIDEACLLDRVVVLGDVGGDQIDVYIRSIRSLEVG